MNIEPEKPFLVGRRGTRGKEGTYAGVFRTSFTTLVSVPEPFTIVWILGNELGRMRKPARRIQRKTCAMML
jgi:hypothetical protein